MLDWRALPLPLAATLAAGLREDSRVRMKLSGSRLNNEIWLLAAAVDRLSVLVWQRTKDGATGHNYPNLIIDRLTAMDEPQEVEAFDSGEEFLKAWRAL